MWRWWRCTEWCVGRAPTLAMSGVLISASYGEEDQSLGIKFAQVKARGDTLHITIEALRPELQQKFPQLVRGRPRCPARRVTNCRLMLPPGACWVQRNGLILHEVNGQSQHGKEWGEVFNTLKVCSAVQAPGSATRAAANCRLIWTSGVRRRRDDRWS